MPHDDLLRVGVLSAKWVDSQNRAGIKKPNENVFAHRNSDLRHIQGFSAREYPLDWRYYYGGEGLIERLVRNSQKTSYPARRRILGWRVSQYGLEGAE
ncbi:hypothetical protein GCM10025777_50820 [Membranihabitans marinus]|uniref:Uncharacterized protein n=1 Tax=Nesterenkonia rhizosphaerae TaxID=1348272 RepID=A0ABP9FS00_9MICC